MTNSPPIYVLNRITRWASSDAGDAIQIEATLPDGSPIVLRTAYISAARLAQAVVQAAAIAEKIQKKMPGQGLELVSPYMATDVRSGASVDGTLVCLAFQTTEGVPIQLTMATNVAQETILRLSDELGRLKKDPPQKLS
jgi:hypothetical protein